MHPTAPRPEHRPCTVPAGDQRREDEYAWLRQRDDPAVLAHLQAENAHSEAVFATGEDLRAAIFEEIVARVQQTDSSAPVPDGPYEYYTRTVAGGQYRVHCRRPRGGGVETVLLDENAMAQDHAHFATGDVEHSPDHCHLAYTVDRSGAERYTLCIRDLHTLTDVEHVVDDVYYSLAWSNDSRTVLYTRPDRAMRPWQVWRHDIATVASADVLVLEEADERFFVDVSRSRSGELIMVNVASKLTSEVWLVDSAEVTMAPRVVSPRREHVEYSVADHGGHLYIVTNHGAVDFRLMRAPLLDCGIEQWQEVLRGRPGTRLISVDAFAKHLVLYERNDGLQQVRVRSLENGALHAVAQPEAVYTVTPAQNAEWYTDVLRFTYTSLVTPPSTVAYDMNTKERTVIWVQPVLGGYRPEEYLSDRAWVESADGRLIPVDHVRRGDVRLDGSAPLLLYGYGAYEISIDPEFRPQRLPLLDRGCIYAIAHVRGGGEMGRTWYEEGRLEHKHNTFDDFVAVAEYLVQHGFTSTDRLAIRGASAGGLLIGAALNLRPDLFAAAVAQVPFVDCLNTMLDASLPLTVTEYDEWGDPRTPEGHAALRSYSPYDNLREADYPAVLVTAGLNDPRVGYWEAAKWVARLRDRTTGERPVQLVTYMSAGHAGASGRYERWREEALVQAFVVRNLPGFRAPAGGGSAPR